MWLGLDVDDLALSLDCIKVTIKTNHHSYSVNCLFSILFLKRQLTNTNHMEKPFFRNNLNWDMIEHIPAKRLDQKKTFKDVVPPSALSLRNRMPIEEAILPGQGLQGPSWMILCHPGQPSLHHAVRIPSLLINDVTSTSVQFSRVWHSNYFVY